MFLDVTDAGGTVGIEQKGEHIAYPIGKHLTFLYIMWTFGAGIELISLTTRTDFTLGRLFIALILHQVAFSLRLHPGHLSVKNLRQAPQ